jgi:hypothetical protein
LHGVVVADDAHFPDTQDIGQVVPMKGTKALLGSLGGTLKRRLCAGR